MSGGQRKEMKMSNHSQDPAMSKEFIESMGLGPTGQYPQGSIHSTDEGEIRMAIALKDNKVIIHFGTPTAWVGMDKEQAIQLCKTIIEKAGEIL
jgi:hypothetical protein